MSTAKVVTILHPSSAVNNIVNDASGNVAVGAALTASTITSAAATALTIKSAGTTAMTVDTSQNVGIGTTSPSSFASKLVVGTSDNANGVIASAATGLVRIGGYSSGKSAGYIEALNTAQSAFSPLWFGGSILQFATSDSEAMRIDSSGNLLVGTTTYNYSYTGSAVQIGNFSAANAIICSKNTTAQTNIIVFNNPNGQVGYINTSGSSTIYNTTSDYRLKTNVQPMTTGLKKIFALNPVTYDWKVNGEKGEGFIAHELAEVVPLAVSGEKDAVAKDGTIRPQGVDYSKIVVHLVAACQELSAKNDSLEARLAKLETM